MLKAMVALSGGVDSAAGALLLREQGFDVEAVTMVLHGWGEAGAAAALCAQLRLPHHVLDLQALFEAAVIDPFCAAWQSGLTPNPCVLCNRGIKFGALMDWALGRADVFATGHYARVAQADGRPRLMKAAHPEKDQSYVLYTLTETRLARLRLPLGGLRKDEARQIAARAGLDFSQKPESQDICFIPHGDHAGFIGNRSGAAVPGDFVLEDGTVVGRHRGLVHYTVGQRKGLGLAWAHPLYVLRKEAGLNRVVVGAFGQSLRDTIRLRDVHWIGSPPAGPVTASVRTRYHQRETGATVIPGADATARVVFDTPVPGPAPGQAAVFYDGDCVLGGGTIL